MFNPQQSSVPNSQIPGLGGFESLPATDTPANSGIPAPQLSTYLTSAIASTLKTAPLDCKTMPLDAKLVSSEDTPSKSLTLRPVLLPEEPPKIEAASNAAIIQPAVGGSESQNLSRFKPGLLSTETWRNNESWRRNEVKPENRDRIGPAAGTIMGSSPFSLGSGQQTLAPWSQGFGSGPSTDIRGLKSNKEFLRIDLKSGQVKKSRFEKASAKNRDDRIPPSSTEHSSSSSQSASNIAPAKSGHIFGDKKPKDNTVNGENEEKRTEKCMKEGKESEKKSPDDQDNTEDLEELLAETDNAILDQNTDDKSPDLDLALSDNEPEDDTIIAQIRQEKADKALKKQLEKEAKTGTNAGENGANSTEAAGVKSELPDEDSSKFWALKIEQALKMDSDFGQDAESGGSDPGSVSGSPPEFETKSEVSAETGGFSPPHEETTPILQKYDTPEKKAMVNEAVASPEIEEGQSVALRASRSRPGLVFKGCMSMRVKVRRTKTSDVRKFYKGAKKRMRRIMCNQPEIRLNRLDMAEVAQYQLKMEEERIRRDESRKKRRYPADSDDEEEDSSVSRDKKRKMNSRETPPAEPKPYIERFLEASKDGRKSKFQALIERRGGVKGNDIPEDPRTEYGKKSKREVAEHLKFQSLWKDMPKFKIQKREPVRRDERARKTLPKASRRSRPDRSPPSRDEKYSRDRQDESWRQPLSRTPGESWRKSGDKWDNKGESWRNTPGSGQTESGISTVWGRRGTPMERALEAARATNTRDDYLSVNRNNDDREYRSASRDRDIGRGLFGPGPSRERQEPWSRSSWNRGSSRDAPRDPLLSVPDQEMDEQPSRFGGASKAALIAKIRGWGRGGPGSLGQRSDDKYVSPLERRSMAVGRKRPEDQYRKPVRPKVEENKSGQTGAAEEKPPAPDVGISPPNSPGHVSSRHDQGPWIPRTPNTTTKGPMTPANEPEKKVPEPREETLHVVGNFSNMVSRRRAGLLDSEDVSVPEKNIDPSAFVESLSDDEPEPEPEKKDEYDLAMDYLMAGSEVAQSTSTSLPAPVSQTTTVDSTSLLQEEGLEEHEPLVQTALALMDKFGLSVDDILTQSDRAKAVISQLQEEEGGVGKVVGESYPGGASHTARQRSPSPMELDEHFDQNATNFGKSLLDVQKDFLMSVEAGLRAGGLGNNGGQQAPSRGLLGSSPGVDNAPPVGRNPPPKKPLLNQMSDLYSTPQPTNPNRPGLLLEPPISGVSGDSSAQISSFTQQQVSSGPSSRPVLLNQPPALSSEPSIPGILERKSDSAWSEMVYGSSVSTGTSRPVLLGEAPSVGGCMPSTSSAGFGQPIPSIGGHFNQSATSGGSNRKTLITDMSLLNPEGTPLVEMYDPARPIEDHELDKFRGKLQNITGNSEIPQVSPPNKEAEEEKEEEALPYSPQQLLSILELLLEDRHSSLHSDSTKMRKALQLIPELQNMVRMGPGCLNKDVFVAIMEFVLDTVNATVGGK